MVNDFRVNSATKILIAIKTLQPLNIFQLSFQGNIDFVNIGKNRTLPKAGESGNNWNIGESRIYNLLESKAINPFCFIGVLPQLYSPAISSGNNEKS